MVPDEQKVRTDGMDGHTDDAKTISLRLHWGIISTCVDQEGSGGQGGPDPHEKSQKI